MKELNTTLFYVIEATTLGNSEQREYMLAKLLQI